jgi:hypothetical protein
MQAFFYLSKLKSRPRSLLTAGMILIAVFLFMPYSASAQDTPTNTNTNTNTNAEIQGSTCQGAELKFPQNISSVSPEACNFPGQSNPSEKLNALIATIINIFSVVVGVVAVIMIIFGGFRYITSGGDSGNVTNAKNTILYAIVGLIIVALAQFIVKFVLNKATAVGS